MNPWIKRTRPYCVPMHAAVAGQPAEQLVEETKELASKEDRLAEKENQLAEKEAMLNEKEEALMTRLNSEGEQMSSRPYSVREEDVRELMSEWKSMNREMNDMKENLQQLLRNVKRSDFNGVAALCDLYREMVHSPDERLGRHIGRLGKILQDDFEAEPLEPGCGDVFNSELHERKDTSVKGDRILRCIARGWRWKETVQKAIVDIEEGSTAE